MDVEYALIGFASGLIVIAIVEVIQLISGGSIAGIEEIVGMSFYPVLYSHYQTEYSQLPANAINLQTGVSNSFQNYINYVLKVQNSVSTSVNTLAATLQIAAFMGVFIILLELLMRLLMPRNTDVPAGY